MKMNGLSVLKRPAARCTDPLHIVNPPAARRTDPLHNVKRPAARCIEALDHRISGKIFRTDPPATPLGFHHQGTKHTKRREAFMLFMVKIPAPNPAR